MEHLCKDCGKPFILTDEEIKSFEKWKMVPPKRCRRCRREETLIEKLGSIQKILTKIFNVLEPKKENEQKLPPQPKP